MSDWEFGSIVASSSELLEYGIATIFRIMGTVHIGRIIDTNGKVDEACGRSLKICRDSMSFVRWIDPLILTARMAHHRGRGEVARTVPIRLIWRGVRERLNLPAKLSGQCQGIQMGTMKRKVDIIMAGVTTSGLHLVSNLKQLQGEWLTFNLFVPKANSTLAAEILAAHSRPG
ncbi:hypothetical protein FIBSPDRAFT_933273 [Athelia psychrophila]|uniref:Uncharacterized protein n=1 Tax=Athelia psychrophila TaxID=1759441 RepID=A0A166HBL7_9AGAM|nr:hypothetical protein FIBSPDRAFT_933273 [Fibularhizoctonia sp. CBS 109695]